jgi:ankyrin repeat protein
MDLNVQDNYGNTPLHAACEEGSVDVAKILISAGANQYLENKKKQKPLEMAKPQIARAILER